jgi:hypothetical protein
VRNHEKVDGPHFLDQFFSLRGFNGNGPDVEGGKGDGDERD